MTHVAWDSFTHGTGYLTSRWLVLRIPVLLLFTRPYIWRRDGKAVPVSYMHKTFADYFNALAAAGFQTLPKIIELKVTEEHLALDRAFF
jgi:hypothetical protein